jgi:hypothetical protein
LRHQNAVERVTVKRRQIAGRDRVLAGNRELATAVIQ